MKITYSIEPDLDPAEFADVLHRSTLGERRPMDEPDRLKKMVENAYIIVCARDREGRLVGVSRSVTDFAYCCYLSDLAVDEDVQKQGIGKELIRLTQEAAGGDSVALILRSAPAAMEYYPKIGLEKFDNCFGISRK